MLMRASVSSWFSPSLSFTKRSPKGLTGHGSVDVASLSSIPAQMRELTAVLHRLSLPASSSSIGSCLAFFSS